MQTRERVEVGRVHSHREALDSFIAGKREIDAMLQRLTELSADHFGIEPDQVSWGHVETPTHYARLLRELSDSAFQEGEHAA